MSAIALASILVFHSKTKQVEVDFHDVCEKVLRHELCVKFVSNSCLHQAHGSFSLLLLRSKLLAELAPFRLRGVLNKRLNNTVSTGSSKERLNDVISLHKPTHV